MKKKTNIKNGGKGKLITLIVVAAVAAAVVLFVAASAVFRSLKCTYEQQCCITDAGEQVEITVGKILPSRLFISHFNLTNGVNLSQVPFAKLRERLIGDMPNLRDIKIVRTIPNKVRIEVYERTPVVRVLGAGAKANPNYTADTEGKVFWYPRRDTTLLPIIREAKKETSAAGSKLSGMAMAALRLLEEATDPEFAILKIQEVETFKEDYLFATLGDSSRAKIAWEDMDCDTKTSRTSLRRQLKRLSQAMKSNVAAGTKLWNATDWGVPGRIYANDPTKAED
jgi:hypothetical protein